MAIIVNDITLPTSGNNIKVGNIDVTKVNVVKDGVTTTVWERVISITPPASEVKNYINISGSGTLGQTCSSHPNATVVGASVWYVGNTEGSIHNTLKTNTSIFTVTPKDPYTKISCALHKWGLANLANNEMSRVWVTTVVNETTSTVELTDVMTVTNASSIELKCYVYTNGGDHHWKTEAYCCIYNVTLS